jgi:sporulation protein YlmC with PRC-barrel domain
MKTEKLNIKDLALYIAHNCYRNTFIEDLHSGISPSSKTGDFSDVKVVTPYGEIPWEKVSRISDIEICKLNKEVVDKIYTVLYHLVVKGSIPMNCFMMPEGWDEPKINKDMNKWFLKFKEWAGGNKTK